MFKENLEMGSNIKRLSELLVNEDASIISTPKGILGSQLTRFGLVEGQKVHCVSKLPGGTMVIKLNNQEIALGSALTKKIKIEKTGVN